MMQRLAVRVVQLFI